MQQGAHYSPFEEQPSQCLLIDLVTLQKEDLNQLCDSLQSVLRLSYLVDFGFPRIPFFGLCIWNGACFQVIFEFQNLNVQINDAVLAVNNLHLIACSREMPQPNDVRTFLDDFVSKIRPSLNFVRKKPEFSILSTSELFCSQLIDLLKNQDFDSILSPVFEQIKLFHFTHPTESSLFEPTSEFLGGGDLVFSVRPVLCHSISFDRIFRQWLTDKSVNCVQLQLQLPVGCISCDVMEVMLLPENLLFGSPKLARFPIRNLKGIYRLSSKRFSHDMIYGCPEKVIPTSCWKMEWEELSQNKSLFEDLCCSLLANGEILVLQNIKTGDLQSDPFYAFFPEQTAAIISPLIFNEIALPLEQKPAALGEPVSSELKRQIASVPSLDHWNPLLHAPRSAKADQLLSKVEK